VDEKLKHTLDTVTNIQGMCAVMKTFNIYLPAIKLDSASVSHTIPLH
jgi:hypothetical protein